MRKCPVRTVRVGQRNVIKRGNPTHGTVLVAIQRYTPEFDASEADAELTSRTLTVATDATEDSEASAVHIAQYETPVAPSDGGLIWKMPSLKGLSAREAIRALGGHKFQLEVHGSGVVRAQSPDDGKSIADGGTVRLSLTEP